MHAALGEPVRLAIVDHIRLADASPGELGIAFGVPTNLLAHHLRVLEEAGLIRRVRSEGDQRRTYVRLRLEDPLVEAIPGVRAPLAARRVVFVCTHNSARSQLAAAAWSRMHSVPATSAGTRPSAKVHRRAISTGKRHGLGLTGAQPADAADVLRHGDLIVAVCDNAYEELASAGGSTTLHWAVPDPVRINTDAAFERAYQDITRRVDRLARSTADRRPRTSATDRTHRRSTP